MSDELRELLGRGAAGTPSQRPLGVQPRPDLPWHRLPSGRSVQLELPDMWALTAQAGRFPNAITMAVFDLLVQDEAYDLGEDGAGPGADVYLRKRDTIRGLLAVASLCLVYPRLALDRPPAAGEIGPRDLAFADLEVLYFSWFRRGVAPSPPDLPDPADAVGASAAPPAGGELSPAAEPVPGHR